MNNAIKDFYVWKLKYNVLVRDLYISEGRIWKKSFTIHYKNLDIQEYFNKKQKSKCPSIF